jgi:hypothetical protein
VVLYECADCEAKECAEKARLSEILLHATTVLNALERGEAPKRGITLETARKNWRVAKEAYFAHIREHGC